MKLLFLLFLFLLVSQNSIFAQRKGIGGVIKDTLQLTTEKFPVTRGDLPSTHSLIDFMPAVKSQGHLGSCVSWSVVYGAMSIVKRIEKADYEELPYSPIMMHSAYKMYFDSLCKKYSSAGSQSWYCSSATCSSGARPYFILDRLQEYGAAKMYLGEDQYICYTKPPHYTIYPDRIYDFKSIDVRSVEDMKKALLLNSPLIFVIDFYDRVCWADDQYFIDGVWDGVNKGNSDGSHAMIIVGYDDMKAGGAFHVVNSWGDDFGQDGTFWIKYSDIDKLSYAFRIVLDPTKNNELDKVSYPSGLIVGDELQDVTSEVLLTSNQSHVWFLGKDDNTYLVDLKNKKTILQRGWSHLQFSKDKNTLIGLNTSTNKIAIIAGLKSDVVSMPDFNLSSARLDRKKEFAIPEGFQVKSLNLIEQGNQYNAKITQILVISQANRGYILDMETGKMSEVLKPGFRNRKNGYKNFYYNALNKSIVAITPKNGIVLYNLLNREKTVYKDGILSFDSERLYALANDVVLFQNEQKSMLVKLSTSESKGNQSFFSGRHKKRSVIKRDLEFEQPVKSVLITNDLECFFAVGSTVYQRGDMPEPYKALRLTNTEEVEVLKFFSKKNALLIGTQNSIIVYDLKKQKQIKVYKKISALLGVSESGIVIAKDQNNRTIAIDLNWIY